MHVMRFGTLNLLDKLNKKQSYFNKKNDILEEVFNILQEDNEYEQQIESALKEPNKGVKNKFNFELLDTNRIYHISAIKMLCVDYRLRFLDSHFFKGDFPYEAISEIKKLEKEHDITVNDFKIIAPAKLLKLENYDDPILFASIGNGYYYKIHKWGNDLSPFRKIKMYPFRNLSSLVVSALIASIFLTFLVPHGNTAVDPSTFLILFLFMFKSVVGIIIYYGISRGKNVSIANWDSKHYNG